MLNNDLEAKILSSEGAQGMRGKLVVKYWPCAPNGKDDPEDDVLCDEPHELVGKKIWFRVEIDSASGIPTDLCKNCYVEYGLKTDPTVVFRTDVVNGLSTNPKFNYEKVHHIPKVTDWIIDYIDSSNVSGLL
jgi:hypothetical protein